MLGNNNNQGMYFNNPSAMVNPWNGQQGMQMPNPVPNWNRPNLSPAQQQMQQMPQFANVYLAGRIVSNANDIKPNEVPMDGGVGLFPLNDYSCIYAKAWGQNGTIETVKFVPEKAPIDAVASEGPSEFSQVMDRLDRIEQLIGQKKEPYNKHNNNKKEVVSNGNE